MTVDINDETQQKESCTNQCGWSSQPWLDMLSTAVIGRVAEVLHSQGRDVRLSRNLCLRGIAVIAAQMKISARLRCYFRPVVGAHTHFIRDAWEAMVASSKEFEGQADFKVEFPTVEEWFARVAGCNDGDIKKLFNGLADLLEEEELVGAITTFISVPHSQTPFG